MKFIILCLIFVSALISSVVESPILSVDADNNTVTIKIDKIDVGISGFIVHSLSPKHNTILKNVVVKSFDKENHLAILKMSDYTFLKHKALPKGKWKVKVGDRVILAFGYSRAILIAPTEEIYHKITTATKDIQWIHPDMFATILSLNGHPTPLKEDFEELSSSRSIGILFFYINKKMFTLDAKSFTILNISDAPLVQNQDELVLPFYTRVNDIDSNWWGAGSGDLKKYAPHYYELLVESNKKNKKLYNIIKNGDEKLHYLLKEFELKD